MKDDGLAGDHAGLANLLQTGEDIAGKVAEEPPRTQIAGETAFDDLETRNGLHEPMLTEVGCFVEAKEHRQ